MQKNGWTALFFAVLATDLKVLEYLVKTEKVDMAYKDRVKTTALLKLTAMVTVLQEGYTVEGIAKTLNPAALQYLPKVCGTICTASYCKAFLLSREAKAAI